MPSESPHPRGRRSPGKSAPHPTLVTLKKAPGGDGFELVPPACAIERQDDLAEVHSMLEMGEADVAVDELRWLLEGCSDFIDIHRILGEIALSREDIPLARGHFGYAYRIGSKVIGDPPCGLLPYALPANQAFLESAKGLAWCLFKLDKAQLARDVVRTLLACDPSDPLGVKSWQTQAPE